MGVRVMASLLVLRGQVDALCPGRAKGSDGTVGDAEHQTRQSDHNPHNVPGVGAQIVTAIDITHDPAHGCDTYALAETLRRKRDKRVKYMISNGYIFSSYAVGSYAAWTWRPYTGSDKHDTHMHGSVLDAPVSDTTTPWDLEGWPPMTQADVTAGIKNATFAAAKRTALPGTEKTDPTGRYGRDLNTWQNEIAARQLKPLTDAIAAIQTQLDEIKTGLEAIASKLDGAAPGGPLLISGTISGNVSGSFSGRTPAQ